MLKNLRKIEKNCKNQREIITRQKWCGGKSLLILPYYTTLLNNCPLRYFPKTNCRVGEKDNNLGLPKDK